VSSAHRRQTGSDETGGQGALFDAPATAAAAPEEMRRWARISPCGRYRHVLERHWGDGPLTLSRDVLFVMLNPSTADATADDPTIRRCIGFARAWGFEGIRVGNLFDWRSTDPAELPDDDTAVSRECDPWLAFMRRCSELCVVAWGAHPAAARRAPAVLELLGDVHALGLTKDGAPRHPLYLRADASPIPYRQAAAA
jgi:hypothetical protein